MRSLCIKLLLLVVVAWIESTTALAQTTASEARSMDGNGVRKTQEALELYGGRELLQADNKVVVSYSAAFSASSNNCSGWISAMEFGCQDGGEVVVFSIAPFFTSNLPVCQVNQERDDDSFIVCSQTPDEGPNKFALGMLVNFACIGEANTQVLAQAMMGGQEFACLSNGNKNTAIHSVYLDYYAETPDGTTPVSDFDCSPGFTNVNEDGKGRCEQVGQCSGGGGDTCSTELLAVTATQRSIATDDLVQHCSLCYNGLTKEAPDDFSAGSLTCGELEHATRISFTTSDTACPAIQAAGYYLCGCPELPPRNSKPLCTICPDGKVPSSPDTEASLNLGFTPFRLPTCEALDTRNSYTEDFSIVAPFLSCEEYQTVYAVNCGCVAPAPTPLGESPTDGGDDDDNNNNLGAIIGGTFAGVAVILAIALWFVRANGLRKRSAAVEEVPVMETETLKCTEVNVSSPSGSDQSEEES